MKKHTMILKTLFAGGVRASAAVVALILTFLVTRIMSVDEAGLFLFGFTIVNVMATFFRMGMDNIVLREVGANGLSTASLNIIHTGLLVVFFTSIFFATLVSFFSKEISYYVFDKPAFGLVLEWLVLSLPFMVVFMLLSFSFIGQQRIFWGNFFQNLGISSVFIVLSSGSFYLFDYKVDSVSASLFYLLSSIFIFIAALVLWFSQREVVFSIERINYRSLWHSSSNLWVSTTMLILVSWSALAISGVFLSERELAFLSVALRAGMIVSLVITVINMVVAPRYAALWKKGAIDDIKDLSRNASRSSFLLALPVAILMVLFSEEIMGFFGAEFKSASEILVIVVIGQFLAVVMGGSGYILNMSGHEKDFRRMTIVSGVISLLMAFLFSYLWGVEGAAISTSISLFLQSFSAFCMVRYRLGFWPLH